VSDVVVVQQRRIGVEELLGKRRIRAVTVIAGILTEAPGPDNDRIGAVKPNQVGEIEAVLYRRTVVDSVAAADDHLRALARRVGEPHARRKLLVVRVGKAAPAAAAIAVAE